MLGVTPQGLRRTGVKSQTGRGSMGQPTPCPLPLLYPSPPSSLSSSFCYLLIVSSGSFSSMDSGVTNSPSTPLFSQFLYLYLMIPLGFSRSVSTPLSVSVSVFLSLPHTPPLSLGRSASTSSFFFPVSPGFPPSVHNRVSQSHQPVSPSGNCDGLLFRRPTSVGPCRKQGISTRCRRTVHVGVG